MRTMILMALAAMMVGGCSGAGGQGGGVEAHAEAVSTDDGGPSQCPAGFHACSLGTVGYACDDTSWYYCAAEDAGCRTPEPCVPLPPKDAGIDALAAWLARP